MTLKYSFSELVHMFKGFLPEEITEVTVGRRCIKLYTENNNKTVCIRLGFARHIYDPTNNINEVILTHNMPKSLRDWLEEEFEDNNIKSVRITNTRIAFDLITTIYTIHQIKVKNGYVTVKANFILV